MRCGGVDSLVGCESLPWLGRKGEVVHLLPQFAGEKSNLSNRLLLEPGLQGGDDGVVISQRRRG